MNTRESKTKEQKQDELNRLQKAVVYMSKSKQSKRQKIDNKRNKSEIRRKRRKAKKKEAYVTQFTPAYYNPNEYYDPYQYYNQQVVDEMWFKEKIQDFEIVIDWRKEGF